VYTVLHQQQYHPTVSDFRLAVGRGSGLEAAHVVKGLSLPLVWLGLVKVAVYLMRRVTEDGLVCPTCMFRHTSFHRCALFSVCISRCCDLLCVCVCGVAASTNPLLPTPTLAVAGLTS
jgi:hypothetical protein